MFKLVVLSTLLAIAAAKPSGIGLVATPVVKTTLISEPAHIEVKEPVIAKVGDIVQSVPTAVSHQSSTVVHSKANVVTPIVAPAVKSYYAPAVKTYAAPVVSSAPVLSYSGSYHAPAAYHTSAYSTQLVASAPLVKAELKAFAPEFKTEVKTLVAPQYQTLSAPIVKYSEPIIKYAETPVYKTYASAPLVTAPWTYAVDAPVIRSYATAPVYKSYATPLVKSYSEW